MLILDKNKDRNWLKAGLESLKSEGFFVLTGVLSEDFLKITKKAMYEVQKKIYEDIGETKLTAAGEWGVLRLMMRYDSFFIRFLEFPEVLNLIDSTVSSTAIMHLQNGFILPPFKEKNAVAPRVFQNQFHRDVRRVLNKFLCSINIFFTIDSFTESNGATRVIPGSHQKEEIYSQDMCEKNSVPIICPAGSLIVFDSTLWHAAGQNTSLSDRLAINHQFTQSYFKPQIDYARALDVPALHISERSKQLLGWYTRVPSSLEEYYVPSEDRLYRAGQG